MQSKRSNVKWFLGGTLRFNGLVFALTEVNIEDIGHNGDLIDRTTTASL
jgi:hypothetical protein